MFSEVNNMDKSTLDALNSNFHRLRNKIITLGFDGFTDTIFKVIKSKEGAHATDYFSSSQEFGNYIIEKCEKNFSLELELLTTKIGGNMPIMANALAQFGAAQNCIGSLGYPVVHPQFRKMPPNCTLFSFADPGLTKALEFGGSKMMLAEIGSLNLIEWTTILDIVGRDNMFRLFAEPDLICMLNWSELDNSTDIWKGILTDIFPALPKRTKPIGFFDLADCSKRTPESIAEAMELLQAFSTRWNVVLSLNLNEATIVDRVLCGSSNHSIEAIGESLYNTLNIGCIVIHYSKQALSWSSDGRHCVQSYYVSEPKLSTGAGDNFNAGFCAGMLMDLDQDQCLSLGHAMSNLYMRNAASPQISELKSFLALQPAAASKVII